MAGTLTNCGCYVQGKLAPQNTTQTPFVAIGAPPLPNIPSLVNSVVQIQNALAVVFNALPVVDLNTLGGGGGGFSNGGGGGGRGGGGGNGGNNNNNNNHGSNQGKKPKKQQPAHHRHGFQEVSRATQQVQVYNPNDKTQYVTVVRITQLKMRDKATGVTWQWQLQH